jgi:hypothetical protein
LQPELAATLAEAEEIEAEAAKRRIRRKKRKKRGVCGNNYRFCVIALVLSS